MAINSCTSSSNLATQYAEQLTQLQDPQKAVKRHPNADSQPGATTRDSGPTVNGQGEQVGTLVNSVA
jgi:hypothetical protein